MSLVARALGAAPVMAATFALAWASTVRIAPYDSETSLLRLTWTARPERVEDCRSLSDDELAKLPAHMRQSVVCEGTTAAYRLQVVRDGAIMVDQVVRGGGLRHDRPLYVFKDVPVPPGEASILVRFERLESIASTRVESAASPAPQADGGQGDEHSSTMNRDRRQRDDDDRFRRRSEVAPASLTLEQRFRFTRGQVILVTYDSDRRQLTALESAGR